MSRANEFYKYEEKIAGELRKLSSTNDINMATLLKYYRQSVAEGLSLARVHKRLSVVARISRMLGKKFEDATKDDIVELVAKIEEKKIREWTKADYKVVLKKFYRWLKGKDGEAPPEVKWIKLPRRISNNLQPKDLLTPEEVNRIIECADDIQSKAFFSVLFDSGRRLGEILGLIIGDIEFDDLGARLRVDGKTGPDTVRISASAPRLALWLDNHPLRNDPKAPVWIAKRKGEVKQLSYSGLGYRFRHIVERTGIKKRVWNYLLRHSRITPASKKLSYAQMCQVFGWKMGSDMPQYYVHLSSGDRDEAYLKMNGLAMPESVRVENGSYVKTTCPRCRRDNSPDAKFCNACGLALDLKHAVEADQRKEDIREKLETISTELAKSPEVVDSLLAALVLAKEKKG